MTAGFENGGYYFFAGKNIMGHLKGYFEGGQYFLTLIVLSAAKDNLSSKKTFFVNIEYEYQSFVIKAL